MSAEDAGVEAVGTQTRDYQTIQAFIFDMDGVLVDSDRYHFLALRQTLDSVGIKFTQREYLNICLGRNTEHNLTYLMGENGRQSDIQWLVSQKRQAYLDMIQRGAIPMDGVVDALSLLRQAKFKLGVASSSHKKAVESVLERLRLDSAFDLVVHADMISETKPSPEIYLLAANLLGISPQECIAVEDSKAGMESAISAGMRVIMVRNRYNKVHDFTQADWVLESLEHLIPSFLESQISCIH